MVLVSGATSKAAEAEAKAEAAKAQELAMVAMQLPPFRRLPACGGESSTRRRHPCPDAIEASELDTYISIR
jgi:hypothetical protein